MNRIALYIFFCLALSSCSTCGFKDKLDNVLDSGKAIMDQAAREDSLRQARIEQIHHEIDSIKAACFAEEPGLLTGVYINKGWDEISDENLFGLKVVVYDNGDFALISMLPEQQFPLHNRIEIVIGQTHFTTDTNYTYPLTEPDASGYNNLPDVPFEALYILQTDCEDIVQAIAESGNAEVKVYVYYNDEEYANYELSASDRKCFVAAYRIYLLSKELETLEAQDVEWDD